MHMAVAEDNAGVAEVLLMWVNGLMLGNSVCYVCDFPAI